MENRDRSVTPQHQASLWNVIQSNPLSLSLSLSLSLPRVLGVRWVTTVTRGGRVPAVRVQRVGLGAQRVRPPDRPVLLQAWLHRATV